MEKNKFFASLLLAGVIAMASGTAAKIVFNSETHKHEGKRGYSIEVASDDAEAAGKSEVSRAELLASADIERGKVIAKKCLACHSFEKGGANKVGPNLWGVIGHDIASANGFAYSKVLIEMEGNWDIDKIWKFVNNPKKYATGTKMAFAGIKKPEQIADLVAYINSMNDSPIDLSTIEIAD